jgi:pimeloyl-ACP methyl ester carboxylesterase
MELYNYNEKPDENYNLEEICSESLNKNGARKFVLTYDSPFETGIKENDVIYSELFLSPDQISQNHNFNQLIILVHGFNGRIDRLKNYYHFIDKVLQNNISCLFINLPYHLYRTPEGYSSGQMLLGSDDTGTINFFHQAVADIRKAIDFIKINFSERKFTFSICGISLGGMVSVITMAWEKRIKKGAFLLCGGNWNEIYWNGIIKIISRRDVVKKEKITREQASKFYSELPEFIAIYKKINPSSIDMELENYPELKKFIPKKWFLCDPLTFSHKIRADDVLMINSKFDFFFNKESVLQLWKELGNPRLYWLNNFHTSVVLASKRVQNLIFDLILPNGNINKENKN